MTKCSVKSCFEPVFKDGFCETHYEHEQRILARATRVEAQIKAHGISGGVLRDLEGKTLSTKKKPTTGRRNTPSPAPSRTKDELVGVSSTPPRTCAVPRCGEHFPSESDTDNLGLCKACKSLYRIWHRHTLANQVSPMTPSPEQLLIFQRIQPPRRS